MSMAPPYAIGLFLRAYMTLLLCSPTAAFSADWRLSAIRQTHYGASLAFLDVSSVHGGGGQVSFAASTYFSRRTGRMNRVTVRVTASCSAMTFRFDQIVLFYNQRPLHQWAHGQIATAIPQTDIFDEIVRACGMVEFGSHIEVPEAFAARYFAEGRRGGL